MKFKTLISNQFDGMILKIKINQYQRESILIKLKQEISGKQKNDIIEIELPLCIKPHILKHVILTYSV
tara:strand:+ start:132 stop:335 length:204 start_codon:yes stop_codon:yes gene_type:complete